MSQTDRVFRPLAAVGLVGAPLLVLVLPPLLTPAGDFATAEEQFEAMAGGPPQYGTLLVQAAGALCLIPAALGVLAVVTARRRGGLLGGIDAVVGVVGAGLLLLVLGIELTQGFILAEGSDPVADVDVALTVNDWSLFGWLLVAGFACLLLTPFLASLALWRARLVRGLVPAAFVVAVLVSLVPMPPRMAALLPAVCLLVPCVWLAVRLLRPVASPARVDARPLDVGADAPVA